MYKYRIFKIYFSKDCNYFLDKNNKYIELCLNIILFTLYNKYISNIKKIARYNIN